MNTQREYRVMITGHRPDKLGGYAAYDVHRQVHDWLLERLIDVRKVAVSRGLCISAITGMAIGTDQIFAQAALALDIPYDAYVPFKGQDARWSQRSRELYRVLLGQARNVVVVSPGGYATWKLQKRNETMVDIADQHLAVWDGSDGGTANCVRYMRLKKIEPIPLNPRSLMK